MILYAFTLYTDSMNIKLFISSLFLAFLPGWIGSYFTYSKIPTWYALLQKPEFSPPNFVFGPVWTTLYILMGISLYLIWSKKVTGKKVKLRRMGLKIFGVQLILNGLWSIVFFGAEEVLFAFIVILGLWGTIIFSMYYFNKISKVATYLLIPYLLWVTFASVLNLSIFLLN